MLKIIAFFISFFLSALVLKSNAFAEEFPEQFNKAQLLDKSINRKQWAKVRPKSRKPLLNALSNQEEVEVLLSYADLDEQSTSISNGLSLPKNGAKLTQKYVRQMKLRAVEANQARLARLSPRLQGNGISLIKAYKHFPVVKLKVRRGSRLADLLAPDLVVDLRTEEYFQLALNQSAPLIAQPTAFNGGLNGDGVGIAVVDSGVDYQNAAFGCSSPGQPTTCKVVATYEAASEDNQLDSEGHGTLVAGIAAGIAPQADLISIDAFGPQGIATSDILDAIDWILDNQFQYNIKVANFSLGSTQTVAGDCDDDPFDFTYDPMYHAFVSLRNAGILPVVASGNAGAADEISVPACYTPSFAVGATYDQNLSLSYGVCTDLGAQVDDVACFSNTSEMVDIMAPGTLIAAAGMSNAGTSMATPHVSAAAALALQVDPNMSPSEIEQRLKTSVVHVSDSKSNSNPPGGFPRLHLASALNPINDDFVDAPIASAWQTLEGTSVFSSAEQNEPQGVSRSVWYRYFASQSDQSDLSLGSSNPQLMHIYSGTSLQNLTYITTIQSGDAQLVNFLQGQTYYFQIAGDGDGSAFQIEWLPPSFDESDEDIPFLPPWALIALALLPFVSSIKRKKFN